MQSKISLGSDFHLGVYHAYWFYPGGVKIRNPDFDDFSSAVLDMKKEAGVEIRTRNVNYFVYTLTPLMPDSVSIAYLPSSNTANTNTGIREIAQRLSALNGNIDATSCLVRTKDIPKLASGGNRDPLVHRTSLMVTHAELIKNKNVLLMDDVAKTGGSLLVGRELLMKAGAKSVTTIALGKTIG